MTLVAPPVASSAILNQAAGLVTKRHFAAAAERFAGLTPLDERSRYSLGLCLFAAGRREEGVAAITTALSAHPGLLPWVRLGEILELLVEVGQALADMSPAAAPSVRLSILWATGEALMQRDRASEAVELFVRIIRELRPVNTLAPEAGPSEDDVRAMVHPQEIWHSMDLGPLFVEGWRKSSRVLAGELLRLDLPDMTGKSVLDIGAWDGFFSFECERRGARAVTALDFHSWITDLSALRTYATAYMEQHQAMPDLYAPPGDLQDRTRLPGRRAFDVARSLLGSGVRPVCEDFRTVDAARLGTFDVVLFLGVLYHLTDPLDALRTLHALTGEVAIVETLGMHFPDAVERPSWEFVKDARVNADPTTWWMPNEQGLHDMLEAAGFRQVRITSGASSLGVSKLDQPTQIRIMAHAWK